MSELFGDSNVFDTVVDMEPVKEGKYTLKIADLPMEHTSAASGKPSIKLSLSIGGHEDDAWNIGHYVSLPTDEEYAAFKQGTGGDDAKKANTKLSMLKAFLKAFDLDATDFGPSAWPGWQGAQAEALVIVEETNTGNMRNTVRRFF